MCGITAGIAHKDIVPFLIEGLKRLEYRGYDSAGVAILNHEGDLERLRICGKVSQLQLANEKKPLLGKVGIAHTRWATHGKPNESNAHPHMFDNKIALVHNGIIENYLSLRETLQSKGIVFTSETDSEVIVQWIGLEFAKTGNLLTAVQSTLTQLQGAYSLAVVSKEHPDRIIAAKQGSPLVLGLGEDENFVASDSLALLSITQNFVMLEDGDVAEIFANDYVIYDHHGQITHRDIKKINLTVQSTERGKYAHFMQKEIFEQPQAALSCLEGRLLGNDVSDLVFGEKAGAIFDKTKAVQIAACGTSFHAGLMAKYWIEQIIGIPCFVEVASELRHRNEMVLPGTLFIAISQSGETADTLSILKNLKSKNYSGTLSICNVPESAIVRASELVLLTHAGPEIGVATTKGFTTQCLALLMLIQCLGKRYNANMSQYQIVQSLRNAPQMIEKLLLSDKAIAHVATFFQDKDHALFIGRGIAYPIAKEGALKLMEISYIHAQAYPGGELKHGPLALVDENMPVIALLAKDNLTEKLMSNLQEIKARGGRLFVFAQSGTHLAQDAQTTVIEIPALSEFLTPIAFTILLQLLSYHVALLKGTDVDQPRNLAKSVTVE